MSIQLQHLDVLDASMAYYQQGDAGQPVVFLHGMPTSSYLWRNIVPELATVARCYAPDLIGMGESACPNIHYSFEDQLKYFTAFMQALNLEPVTLVMHGWGSAIGLAYAARNPDKVTAIALYEAFLRPIANMQELSLPVQALMSRFQDPEKAYKAVVEQDFLVEQLIPAGSLINLSPEVMQHYRQPFIQKQRRKVLWEYIKQVPLGRDLPFEITPYIVEYMDWLTQSNIPKLLMYGMPGFWTTIETVSKMKDQLANITISDLGDSMHLAQESNPKVFAELLCQWYTSVVAATVRD